MPKNIKTRVLTILFGFFSLALFSQDQVWSLKKCIEFAIDNNIDVLISQKQIETSDINLNQSQMERLPSLNGFGSHGYFWGRNVDRFTNQFTNSSIQSNNFSLSSGIVLFDGFQTSNGIAKFKIESQLAIERLNQIKNDISLQVAAGYLSILMSKESLQITKTQRENTLAQVEKTKTMVEVGQIPKGDLLDVEAQLAQDELNITIAENNLSMAKLNLTQLLQLNENEAKSFKVIDGSEKEVETNIVLSKPEDIYKIAMGQMPEIKAQMLRVGSAGKDLIINKGRRSPTLSMNGSFATGYSSQSYIASAETEQRTFLVGYTSISKEAVFATVNDPIQVRKPFDTQLKDNRNFNLSLQLNIPIFNKFVAKSAINRSKIALESANLNLEKEKNNLRNDINRAHTDATAALKKYSSAKKSAEAVNASFDNAQLKFEQNIISSYEFNELKNRLLRVQSEVLQAKYDLIFKSKILDFYQGKDLVIN